MVLNANSILSRKKSDALEALVHYTKPDAILISETKLHSTISNSCFPEGYTIIKKDRLKGGGGVSICVKD